MSRIQRTTSIGLALVVVLLSLSGLLFPGIYQDRVNPIPANELTGQDAVTLAVGLALTVLVGVLWNGSFKGKVLYLGLMLYVLYTYMYFCFSLVTSPLFVLYIAAAMAAAYTLLFSVNRTFLSLTAVTLRPEYPARAISAFLAAASLLMIGLEVPDVVRRTTGSGSTVGPYDVYLVLDLALLFPGMLIAAWKNVKKDLLGVSLAGILLFKAVTLLPALILSDFLNYLRTGAFRDPFFALISLVITALAAIGIVFFMRGVEDSSRLPSAAS